jgi:hypothetical protein
MGMKKGLLAAGFIFVTAHVFGQMAVDGAHYPAGLNGTRAGIPGAPGIYLRDDNWFFTAGADRLGESTTRVYVQAPQLTWLTDWKILGANIGADIMAPLVYKEENSWAFQAYTNLLGKVSHKRFGLGDIKIEPLVLAWHWDQWDVTAAYAVWAPSGHFSVNSADNLGDGEWTHMISLGTVWYPDEEKTWAVSILHHFEINSAQIVFAPGIVGSHLATADCSTYTLEWAVSKTVFDHIDLGLAGYYQQQFSDSGAAINPGKDSDVVGMGPEISVLIPGCGLSAALRYAYEFVAHDRPEGQTVDLSLTKKF